MKKILAISLVVLMAAATHGYAQTDGGMKDEMKQMMDNGMMKKMMSDKKDMMQMMMDMMTMQETMMKGPSSAEKKRMTKDMAQMKEKIQNMMSMPMPMDMTGMDDSQAKLTCAEQWLTKAIELHEVHMKDPKTAIEASQMEMMDQMKKAYACITGTGPDVGGTQPKETADKEPKKMEPSKTDQHKH